jgi:hypothetical protein
MEHPCPPNQRKRSSAVGASRTSVTWRDLDGQPFITLSRDGGIRLLVEIGFEQVQVPLQPAYEVS